MKIAALALTTLTILAATVVPTGPQAQAAPVGECTNAQVRATYRATDAAMMHAFGRIVLRNVSHRTCSVRGFGGLSYVGGGDGAQVGAAATRDPQTAVSTIVLAPGHRARSVVAETSVGAYDPSECTRVAVDGFRVYVPDSTASQFVAHPTTTCAQADLNLLSHQAFRR